MGQAAIAEAKELRNCLHCDTEFRVYDIGEDYCCSGCEYVDKLIHEEKLDRFYQLKNTPKAPVGYTVFSEKNFDWLREKIAKIESQSDLPTRTSLALSGISCIGCVWLIEQLFSKQTGSRQCRINVQRSEIEIEWRKGEFDAAAFATELRRFGYDLSEKRTGSRPSEHSKLIWRMALCGAFALNGMLYTFPRYLGMEESFLFSLHFHWLSGIFATLSMIVGGSYFIKRAFVAAQAKIIHMDLPIAIGLVVAFAASLYAFLFDASSSLLYFDFISTFVFLMLCGKWLQIFAIERNRNRLTDIEIEPPKVDKTTHKGCIRNFDSSLIEPDDRYFLNPGHWVPVASKLLSEQASQGMDWINGETDPRLFTRGSRVPSGSINQSASPIELIAEETWGESLLCTLLNSREQTSRSDAVTQLWITRYLLAIMAIAFLGSAVWAALASMEQAMLVFVSALVVSCPCALGVALPLANELAVSKLKLKGVFVRSSSLWNRLNKVSRIVFDKTGTLTRSTLDWINPQIIEGLDKTALEAINALTQGSCHPVALTIRETLFAKGYSRTSSDWQVEEVLGKGAAATKNGITWRLGKASWAADGPSGETVLSADKDVVGVFHFEDRPWADARNEIAALSHKGYRISILSGDKRERVLAAAKTLGIQDEDAISDASPHAKQRWLHDNAGDTSLVLGDGANDSLAFDEALCCGTPAAEKSTLASKSDFYYLGAGIRGVGSLLNIASQRRKAIWALMAFALTYNLLTLSLALAGVVTPLLAAILMPLSSLISIGIVWTMLRS